MTPAFERQDSSAVLASSSLRCRTGSGGPEPKDDGERIESGESGRGSSNFTNSRSFRLRNLHRYIEGEQVAAGWPSWLSAVAGEAIQGWVPLKADNFEKLEKVMLFLIFIISKSPLFSPFFSLFPFCSID